jgi:hypothetical protein
LRYDDGCFRGGDAAAQLKDEIGRLPREQRGSFRGGDAAAQLKELLGPRVRGRAEVVSAAATPRLN